MISKCANPECAVPLRYLRHGRIFRFDIPSLSFEMSGNLGRAKIIRKVSHFWLCGHCCQTMTLIFDPVYGAVVQHPAQSMFSASNAIDPPLSLPNAAAAHV